MGVNEIDTVPHSDGAFEKDTGDLKPQTELAEGVGGGKAAALNIVENPLKVSFAPRSRIMNRETPPNSTDTPPSRSANPHSKPLKTQWRLPRATTWVNMPPSSAARLWSRAT